MKYFAQLNLEELWIRTLQEIDFLHDEAQRNDAEMAGKTKAPPSSGLW